MQSTLSAEEQVLTPQQTERETALAFASERVRILIIDDHKIFLDLVKELLESNGFEVETAANPVKALEQYTTQKNRADLVLLDYYMPVLDGAKTFEWLRKLNPNVKVIICSGAEELRLRQLQSQHAIDGYIHKPFRIQEAMFVIRQVMSRPVRRS